MPAAMGAAGNLRMTFKSAEPAEQIRIRIYSLRGTMIKELTAQNLGNQFGVEWDGRDQENQITQGIYVYQIEIRGKAYRGVFVIAK